MKKTLLLFLALILGGMIWAQAPTKFTYQAVVRDAGGYLIANDNVGVRVSILQGSASGPAVFSETHTPLTNANGLASFEIGSGVVISGSIATIDWSTGPYFIKTEVDPTGGTSYTIVSAHQMLSVPYALYANEAEHALVADSVVGGVTTTHAYLYAKKELVIQNVASGVNTQLDTYDSYTSSGISFNTSTGVATFNTAGVFLLTAQVSFGAGSNAGRKLLWLNCTSTNWPTRIASDEVDGIANRFTTSFLGSFNVGDQISIGVTQFTGLTLDCPSNTLAFDQIFLNIELIR